MDSLPSLSSRETLARKVVKALSVFGSHSPQDVQDAVDRGDMQHWEEGMTVLVTEVRTYPQLKACEVFMVAGDFDTAWRIHDTQVVPWAKALGCTRMVGRGRMGWIKDLKARGYDRQWIMASKEI